MQKCRVCESEKPDSDCRHLTPRQLMAMDVTTGSIQAVAVVAVASSVVTYDNPPGCADSPMVWICSSCLQEHFTSGDYEARRQEADAVKDLIDNTSQARKEFDSRGRRPICGNTQLNLTGQKAVEPKSREKTKERYKDAKRSAFPCTHCGTMLEWRSK